jgi:hypothetical protein
MMQAKGEFKFNHFEAYLWMNRKKALEDEVSLVEGL